MADEEIPLEINEQFRRDVGEGLDEILAVEVHECPDLSELQRVFDPPEMDRHYPRRMHNLRNEWPELWKAIVVLLEPGIFDDDDEYTVTLHGEFDADVWAREFIRTVEEHPDIPTDRGTMLGWFANAIMTGYDVAKREAGENVVDFPGEVR